MKQWNAGGDGSGKVDVPLLQYVETEFLGSIFPTA